MRAVVQWHIRVPSLHRVVLFLAVLFAVSCIAAGQEDSKPFGGALPLWEPYWSPHLLLSGASTYLEADDAHSFCMLDIFGDEKPELIVGGRLIHVLTLFDGNLYEECPYLGEEFGLSREGVWAGDMACGDMDGDGEEDLVVVNSSAGVRIFLNRRRHGLAATPESPYQFPAEYYEVMLEDHTGDGLLDAIVYGGENALVLPGNGEGGFETGLPLDGYEGSIWALVSGEYKGDSGLWLLSDEGLWFFPEGELSGIKIQDRGGKALAVADFDLDGNLDLAISRGRSTVEIYLAGPDELVEPTLKLELDRFFQVELVLPGDLNGDNWPDLVAVCKRPPAKLAVFYNLGRSTFGAAYQSEIRNYGEVPGIMINPEHRPRLHTVLITDLTDDGRDDVVLSVDSLFVTFLTPTSEPTGRCFQEHWGETLLGVVDLNNDGVNDLLSGRMDGSIALLQNNGVGLFETIPLAQLPLNAGEIWMPDIARVTDVNGDGMGDLVVWGSLLDSGARVAVWYGNSSRDEWVLGWTRTFLFTEAEMRWEMLASDIDRDGQSEVILPIGSGIVLMNDPGGNLGSEKPDEVLISIGKPVGHFSILSLGIEKLLVGLMSKSGKMAVQLIFIRDGKTIETDYRYDCIVHDLIVADINEDGKDDVLFVGVKPVSEDHPAVFAHGLSLPEDVTLTSFAPVVGILLGNGEGLFEEDITLITGWPEEHIPTFYGGLATGDFNGDGPIDLASGVFPLVKSPGGVVVLLQGEDEFSLPIFLEGGVGSEPLALDMNDDGQDELAVAVAGGKLCFLALGE